MIGALRRRVAIEAPLTQADGGGGQMVSWSRLAEVWARIEPLRGREVVHAQQIQDRLTHRIIIRYRNDITNRHRLTHGSRVFNIRAIKDLADERGVYAELLVEEGVAT